MGQIENTLKPLIGYFVSLERNTMEGWFELKIGLPIDWEYRSNNNIECELLNDTKDGKLLKIKPKKSNISSDDLIEFAILIVQINEEIAKKEKEFEKKMKKYKENLEKEVNKFYDELDEKRKKSFEKFPNIKSPEANKNNVKGAVENTESKKRRGRPPKKKVENGETEEEK